MSLPLCYYFVLAPTLHEMEVISTMSLDGALRTSRPAVSDGLQEIWTSLYQLVTSRRPILEEYKQYALRGAPFCYKEDVGMSALSICDVC